MGSTCLWLKFELDSPVLFLRSAAVSAPGLMVGGCDRSPLQCNVWQNKSDICLKFNKKCKYDGGCEVWAMHWP